MRNLRSTARDDDNAETAAAAIGLTPFDADARTPGAHPREPAPKSPAWLRHAGASFASSSGPGRMGLAIAGVWVLLATGAPIAYWGLDAIAAQPPAFFAALIALAIIPAFSVAMASAAAREVAATRALVAEFTAATTASLIDPAAERDAWRRTLAHAEDSALAIVDLISRERQAASETVETLKSSLESSIQTAARQVRAVREASRLVGEDGLAMEAKFAQTVAAMHDLSQRLHADLQAAEAIGAKAGDVARRVDAESQAAVERLAKATEEAEAVRERLDQSVEKANEVSREVTTSVSDAPTAAALVRPARAATPRPAPAAPREKPHALPYGDIAEDLGLDWLVKARPAAIDMLDTMGIDPVAEIDDRDLTAISRRARLGASARRRAVCDCAPGAVARITYVIDRDAQVKRAAAAFHRDPGFDAAAPIESWEAGSDVVRAYLLLDAALA